MYSDIKSLYAIIMVLFTRNSSCSSLSRKDVVQNELKVAIIELRKYNINSKPIKYIVLQGWENVFGKNKSKNKVFFTALYKATSK